MESVLVFLGMAILLVLVWLALEYRKISSKLSGVTRDELAASVKLISGSSHEMLKLMDERVEKTIALLIGPHVGTVMGQAALTPEIRKEIENSLLHMVKGENYSSLLEEALSVRAVELLKKYIAELPEDLGREIKKIIEEKLEEDAPDIVERILRGDDEFEADEEVSNLLSLKIRALVAEELDNPASRVRDSLVQGITRKVEEMIGGE